MNSSVARAHFKGRLSQQAMLPETRNRTLDPRAKLPQAAVEDLACWNMGMTARRNGLTGYVYKGRRFGKKYHGFNDLAEDLDGNIFVLES